MKPPSVEELVRRYMVEKALKNERKFDIFHPSAWGYCLRKIVYEHYNEFEKFHKKGEQDVDCRMERIYDNGHGTHARWQRYLDGAGVLRGAWKCINPLCGKTYGAEERLGIFNPHRLNPGWTCECGNAKGLEYQEPLVKSHPMYNFEGHVDAIVDVRGTPFATGMEDMDIFVVDMKTMKGDMFQPLEEAKREHQVQVHIYMWLLGLKSSVVLYENKDNQTIKEMFVPRDEKLVEDIKKKSAWLVEVIQRRKLPPRFSGATPTRFPCKGCEYLRICF